MKNVVQEKAINEKEMYDLLKALERELDKLDELVKRFKVNPTDESKSALTTHLFAIIAAWKEVSSPLLKRRTDNSVEILKTTPNKLTPDQKEELHHLIRRWLDVLDIIDKNFHQFRSDSKYLGDEFRKILMDSGFGEPQSRLRDHPVGVIILALIAGYFLWMIIYIIISL